MLFVTDSDFKENEVTVTPLTGVLLSEVNSMRSDAPIIDSILRPLGKFPLVLSRLPPESKIANKSSPVIFEAILK